METACHKLSDIETDLSGMSDNEGAPVPHKSADGDDSTKPDTDAGLPKAWDGLYDHHATFQLSFHNCNHTIIVIICRTSL